MTSPTTEQHANAALVVINAALGAVATAYDYDDIPTTRPEEYVEVSLTERPGGAARNDSFVGTNGWRLTTRWVAGTVTNARKIRDLVFDALRYVPLEPLPGQKTTGVLFETEEPIAPDEGAFSGYASWTFTI